MLKSPIESRSCTRFATDRSHMVLVAGGCGKSGTTLLQAVLSSSEKCNPLIGECGYAYHLLCAYVNAIEHWPEESTYLFADPEDLAALTRDSFEQLFNRIRRRYACDHVVIKSPRLTPLLPVFGHLLNGVVPVVIVRDPLDVVAASVRAEEASGQPHSSSLVRWFAERYVRTYQPLIDCADIISLVKYEQLVKDPSVVVAALSQLTGLASHFDPKDPWRGSEFRGNLASRSRSGWHSPMWNMPLSSTAIGTYKNVLSATEVETVSKICASMSDRFGYSR